MIKSAAQISTVVDCAAVAASSPDRLLIISAAGRAAEMQTLRMSVSEWVSEQMRCQAPPTGLVTTAGSAMLGQDGREASETCFIHLLREISTSGPPSKAFHKLETPTSSVEYSSRKR